MSTGLRNTQALGNGLQKINKKAALIALAIIAIFGFLAIAGASTVVGAMLYYKSPTAGTSTHSAETNLVQVAQTKREREEDFESEGWSISQGKVEKIRRPDHLEYSTDLKVKMGKYDRNKECAYLVFHHPGSGTGRTNLMIMDNFSPIDQGETNISLLTGKHQFTIEVGTERKVVLRKTISAP